MLIKKFVRAFVFWASDIMKFLAPISIKKRDKVLNEKGQLSGSHMEQSLLL
jgi:hypothetical protein